MKLKIINGLMIGTILYLLIDKYRKKKECKCEDKPLVASTPETTNTTAPSVTPDPVLESTNVISPQPAPTESKPVAQPTPAPQPVQTPSAPLLYVKSLGWSSNKEEICNSPSYSNKWMNGTSLGNSSKLYNDSNGANLASSGYYRDGNYWRHWDASAQTFTHSFGCYAG